ncbi:MAG: ComF family protein [Patescibacteria group bacterium]
MLTNTKTYQTIKTGWQFILDAIFPTFCLACDQEGRGWCCDKCWLNISFNRSLFCPACDQQQILGKFCDNCKKDQSLTGLWTAQNYSQPTIRALIHGLKYKGITEIAPRLADLLTITLKIFSLPPAWHPTPRQQWILCPVPLTGRRERERGFNQAELLTQLVVEQNNLLGKNLLIRTKFKKPQVDLPTSERHQNVENAFTISKDASIKDQTIILVDDVYTSGSTMEACAKVLKLSGAREIWGLVVAKG